MHGDGGPVEQIIHSGKFIWWQSERANPCPQFWQRVLKGIRHYTSMHLLLFGEHQSDLLANDRPVYLWRLPKTDAMLIAYNCYQACSSAQQHDLPKITLKEVQIGSTRPRGNFQVLAWRSNIPPYYSYLLNCGVQAQSLLLRIPRTKRPMVSAAHKPADAVLL